MAGEIVTLATHAGTHVDAPYHYGPAATGAARTIDARALLVALRARRACSTSAAGASRVDGVRATEVEAELERDRARAPAGRHRPRVDGRDEPQGAGLRPPASGAARDATEYLVERGVQPDRDRRVGARPAVRRMAEEAKTGDTRAALGVARARPDESEYCQIERLANLGAAAARRRASRLRVPVSHRGRERRLDARGGDLRGGGVSGRLEGKVALVTGAGRGLGVAIAEASRGGGAAGRALPQLGRRRRGDRGAGAELGGAR